MEYSFPRYLLAKQSVDDRALNRQVLEALKLHLPAGRVRVIEVGAGMGNMLARLLSWDVIRRADYVHVDAMEENIHFAAEWLPKWATQAGMHMERVGENQLRLYDSVRDVLVKLVQADVMEFIASAPVPGDLLVAHAFLDLLPMPESMPRLLTLTKDLAWLTINFDGVTSMQPVVDPVLDDQIERLYHRTMDTRATGGDSRAGRHLFQRLPAAGAEILAAGASDWVVYGQNGRYPPQEDYFLYYILHFFEEALHGNPELDPDAFQGWLRQRRAQVERGELVYIAHQMDFLARRR
ncbi:MAG TPA: hypothetical protein VF784_13955 [Anaerolineales bacterium]